MPNWKFLVSVTLIAGAGFVAYDGLLLASLKVAEFPLGAYPIPFSNGVREALAELPDDAHRKFAAKFADAKACLDRAFSAPSSTARLLTS